MPVVLIHKHRNYCIFSLSVLREPWWRLRNSHSALNIENCTCWRRWVGTLNPFFEMTLQTKKSKTHLRLSGLWASLHSISTAKSLTPGSCSVTLGDIVQILHVGIDDYWCPWLNNKTEPFDSQHVSTNHSVVNNWFGPSIRSRDVGTNSNSLLWKLIILEYWDGIFPSPRFLLTRFKRLYQISIWYNLTMTILAFWEAEQEPLKHASPFPHFPIFCASEPEWYFSTHQSARAVLFKKMGVGVGLALKQKPLATMPINKRGNCIKCD